MIVQQMLKTNMDKHTVLNVNIPAVPCRIDQGRADLQAGLCQI